MSNNKQEKIDSLTKQVEQLEKQLHALYSKLDRNSDDQIVTDYQQELKQELNNQ